MNSTDPFNPDETQAPARLRADLRQAYQPPFAVPRRIDDAILNAANARMLAWRRNMRLLRWGGGAAAAAAIILACVIALHRFSASPAPRQTSLASAADRMDLNHDGRVDILDAFYLARQIKAHDHNPTPLPAVFDINGDGVIDQKDVDLIAQRAVRLDASKGEAQ